MAKHAVVRTDLLDGTDVRSRLVSFKFQDAEGKFAEIENGNVVKLDGFLTQTIGGVSVAEREIYKAVAPTAATTLKEIVLVAGVEMPYDERLRNLEDWINPAGKATRGYRTLHSGEIFSVTLEALAVTGSAKPQVGDAVKIVAGTKLAVGGATGTAIGKIAEVEVSGNRTWYAIRID